MLESKTVSKIISMLKNGASYEDIAASTGISKRTVGRYKKRLRDNPDFKGVGVDTVISDCTGARVLVIPDIHAPFTKVEYLEFLKELYKKFKCNTVVFIGDLIDIHTISSHESSTSSVGTINEYKAALDTVADYAAAFPNAKYCMGNHDRRIIKQAATVGIPKEFLKSFRDLYNIPDTWEIADSFIIDNVLYTHGTEFTGRNAIMNITNNTHRSTVVGHAHSSFGVVYTNSGYDQFFSMEVGCLLDKDAYAFDYGANNKFKPILGAGVVISDKEAYCVPYNEG